MYHQHLERQIKKHLSESLAADPHVRQFLDAVSQSYHNYDRDRELSEHAFTVNEFDYQQVNKQLRDLTSELEEKVRSRTSALEDIAQFPLENPNPIFRYALDGKLLFTNPAASTFRDVIYEGKKMTIKKFFAEQMALIKNSGTFDIICNNLQYIFYYKKIEGKNYINFYGADVTEKNNLRIKAQENFQRLRNFLETTEDAYYIIYAQHKEKSFVTTRWQHFFGFEFQPKSDNLLLKSKVVKSESAKQHHDRIKTLKVGNRISIRYSIKNPRTGQEFWLSEVISKQYDLELDDIVVSGRITDITKEHHYAMQMQESEERFRNLVNSMPVMVWVSDENEKVIYSNKLLHDFLPVPLEDIKTDADYHAYVHPDDRTGDVTKWRKSIRSRKVVSAEYRLMDSNGKYHNIFEKAVPRFYADGKYAGHVGTLFDLTMEKQYQETISLEKEKLELLTRNSPDIILLTNHLGDIEYVSPTAQRILGYKEKEMVGNNLKQFICKECKDHLESIRWLQEVKKGKDKFEFRMILKNGKLIWVESVMSVIQNKTDKGYKILMHNRDIDSIKKAEMVLKENEQKYRGLFENMQLGVMEVDLDEKIQWVNKSFENITGYSLKYLKGKKAVDVFLADERTKRVMNVVKRTRTNRNESIYEIKMRKNKGEVIDMVISGSPIIGMNGEVKGSVGIHWDVTEIRRMEQMIEEERLIRQREVMKATLNAEEQQREILGNELHDGVGHILTYTSLFLQMASQSDKLNPELFTKAHQKVDEALKEVRRISRSLVPPALIDLGLKDAIIELFNQYSDLDHLSFSIDCKHNDFIDVDINAQRNIYRMMQELLNNTIKHAQASNVKLTIKKLPAKMLIQYYNDGKHFNPDKVKKGVGLNSIMNRAYFYNGTVDVVSAKQQGTYFNIELPLKNLNKYE